MVDCLDEYYTEGVVSQILGETNYIPSVNEYIS